MRLLVRILLIGVLSLGLLGAGVHYDTNYGNHWPYPSSDDLATEYASYVGEDVFLFGTVERVEGDTARIAVSHGGGSMILRIENFDASVRAGGFVQVAGEVRPDRTISAENVVVVNPSGTSNRIKYAVSLVGLLLVSITFFRRWRIDIGTLSFEVR